MSGRLLQHAYRSLSLAKAADLSLIFSGLFLSCAVLLAPLLGLPFRKAVRSERHDVEAAVAHRRRDASLEDAGCAIALTIGLLEFLQSVVDRCLLHAEVLLDGLALVRLAVAGAHDGIDEDDLGDRAWWASEASVELG